MSDLLETAKVAGSFLGYLNSMFQGLQIIKKPGHLDQLEKHEGRLQRLETALEAMGIVVGKHDAQFEGLRKEHGENLVHFDELRDDMKELRQSVDKGTERLINLMNKFIRQQ